MAKDPTAEYVQTELVKRGSKIVVDGDFGPKSKKALADKLGPETVKVVASKDETPAGVKLDARSERNLAGVHADLVKVVRRAAELSTLDFIITEGVRSVDRQRQLVAKGASTTMRSRHITGHAVDVAIKVGGQIRWDWPLYNTFSSFMKAASKELGIKIKWGGDWTSFKDGPHYQLTWVAYP